MGCYVLSFNILASFTPEVPFSFDSDYLLSAGHSRQFRLFVPRGNLINIDVPEDYG